MGQPKPGPPSGRKKSQKGRETKIKIQSTSLGQETERETKGIKSTSRMIALGDPQETS